VETATELGGQVLDWLGKGWVGSVLGLLGLGFAYYFFKRDHRVKRLSYGSLSISLIQPTDGIASDIEVLFRGRKIEQVSMTLFIIWNHGNETIRGSEIAYADPLCLCMPDDRGEEILEAQVKRITRPAINMALTKCDGDDARRLITFDFLDPGDGASIEVLHNSLLGRPTLKGTIVGMPAGATDIGAEVFSPTYYDTGYVISWKWQEIALIALIVAITIFAVMHSDVSTPGLRFRDRPIFTLLLMTTATFSIIYLAGMVFTKLKGRGVPKALVED
jgi:hypothetical protein